MYVVSNLISMQCVPQLIVHIRTIHTRAQSLYSHVCLSGNESRSVRRERGSFVRVPAADTCPTNFLAVLLVSPPSFLPSLHLQLSSTLSFCGNVEDSQSSLPRHAETRLTLTALLMLLVFLSVCLSLVLLVRYGFEK